MALLSTLILIAILVGIFILYVKWKLSYWKRRGVPHRKPDFLFGNARKQLEGTPLSELIINNYLYAKSQGYKHYGGYIFISPTYTPIDMDIIKQILQKDFSHFSNRGFYINEEDDPLTGNLFNLEDEKWRNLRVKLTPTFTSGKMKMMFPTLIQCTEGLEEVLRDHSVLEDPIDIKDIVGRFTTDIIGSCAFGLDCNSLKNPNSEFRHYGKMIFDPPFRFQRLRTLLFFVLPRGLLKFFKIKQIHPEIESFFMNIVKNTIQYREENNVFRKDFLHLLLQLKNKGELTDDEADIIDRANENTSIGIALSMNEIAAQCFVFFAAGFETSATTLTFALLELAINQDIQDKLRNDINNILAKHSQKLTYEGMMEMAYLDKVVNETLRRHPPFPGSPRVCTKQYRVPGTDVILEPGTRVTIPSQAIQRDPEYYPDPETFDPERFNEENKTKRPAFAFLPFGEGPRICIGARFALMQVKVGLIAIIRNFRVTINEKTQLPIRYESKQFINSVRGGAWLNISKINEEMQQI